MSLFNCSVFDIKITSCLNALVSCSFVCKNRQFKYLCSVVFVYQTIRHSSLFFWVTLCSRWTIYCAQNAIMQNVQLCLTWDSVWSSFVVAVVGVEKQQQTDMVFTLSTLSYQYLTGMHNICYHKALQVQIHTIPEQENTYTLTFSHRGAWLQTAV